MISQCEVYMLDVIKRRRHGLLFTLLRGILQMLSWPYRLGVGIKNWGYNSGWLKQYHPPVPVVISVGNIVAGGTGKTPTTLMIAKAFYAETQIGILTRGYRSLAEKSYSPITLCSGQGPLHSAAYCGDEPFLLADNLPKSYVIVGKDRRKGARLAAAAGVRMIILDDGMQHRQIGRDFEIVSMDADDPFGQGYFLPRGLLRDSEASLARADLVMVNYLTSSHSFEQIQAKVQKYTKVPIVGTSLSMEGLYDLQGKSIPPSQYKRAAIFCGIANPERFKQTISATIGTIVYCRFYPDHHLFNPEQIIALCHEAKEKGADLLVCTEKDKVKLKELSSLLTPIPLVWMKMGMQITHGQKHWEEFLKKVRTDLRGCL